ncbi:MAG: sensor domain-containing diguanylate cyclase [Ghiorsea sp.]
MVAIEHLLEISIRLSAERNLDDLLNLIIDQMNTLLEADRSSLFWVNEEENCLESKIAQGVLDEVIQVPMNEGIVGWVAEHKKIVNISDVQQDDRHYHVHAYSFPVRSMLCVPLLDAGGNLHGVMQAMRSEKKPFSAENVMLIKAMASQATVAINNALLNKQMEEVNIELERKVKKRTEELERMNIELQKIAVTDALTAAYNRRYFNQMLAQEKSLSERYGIEFSLVMLDIDYFKNINDNMGHDAGDAVLKQLAKLTQSLLRDCDYLFRFGGEEFIILLPRTGPEGAKVLAERIRLAISHFVFVCLDEQIANVTVSLGIVTWKKGRNCNPEHLLKSVDQALYHSKENGRNQVTVA